jgi:GT2 family glycosyltransferase/glycosyltransferase involved in cell wall biosynthesis
MARNTKPSQPKTTPRRTRARPAEFEGVLEGADWDAIRGWAWSPVDPERRVVLDILVDGTPVLDVTANQFRQDLLIAKIGDGGHSFRVCLPQALFSNPIVRVQVLDKATGRDLAGSPVTLMNHAAGLNPLTREFLATQIDALVTGGAADLLEENAAFLLAQFDRLLQAREQAAAVRLRDFESWSQLLRDQGRDGPGKVSGLIDLARHQYGERPLRLPTSEAPEVSVIIPVHGKFWYTYQCLRAIAEHAPRRPFEVIVVDDCSTDETLLAPLIVSGVRVLRNERNLGFVGSVNAGAAMARGRNIMLLNNDTEVQPGWMDELCDSFERDGRIGIAGSKLLFPNGTLQECGGIVWRLGDGWNYGRDQDPERPEFCALRDVDYVSGAALMIRREVWDAVGGLSEEYAPAYYEDTDLCFKVREAGHRVVVQPYSRVVHHEGVSAGTDVSGAGMKRYQRTNMARFAARWRSTLQHHAVGGSVPPAIEAERYVRRRALFIDDSVPTPDRDAGSTVAVEHIKSLMRLGYQVHFVPSDNMARIPPYTDALERIGVRCHYAPFEASPEEVLRNNAGAFDLIYLHRVSNARYMSLARARNPDAQVVYNVADLHHLRLLREAEVTANPRLLRDAQAMRVEELAAVAAADCTIVHSTHEATVLAHEAPMAPTVVMPWVVHAHPTSNTFAARKGLAFVGSTHGPNIDAAEFLVREVMPLVWADAPGIVLHLIGSHCGDRRIRDLAGPRVRLDGWVPDLAAVLATMRLTIAPLRFGAGLKGKVLDSMAAGLPCVMTRCAAEGAAIPAELDWLIADDPLPLAELVLELHADPAANARAAEAGLRYIRQHCSEARIDDLISAMLRRDYGPGARAARGGVIQLPSVEQRLTNPLRRSKRP